MPTPPLADPRSRADTRSGQQVGGDASASAVKPTQTCGLPLPTWVNHRVCSVGCPAVRRPVDAVLTDRVERSTRHRDATGPGRTRAGLVGPGGQNAACRATPASARGVPVQIRDRHPPRPAAPARADCACHLADRTTKPSRPWLEPDVRASEDQDACVQQARVWAGGSSGALRTGTRPAARPGQELLVRLGVSPPKSTAPAAPPDVPDHVERGLEQPSALPLAATKVALIHPGGGRNSCIRRTRVARPTSASRSSGGRSVRPSRSRSRASASDGPSWSTRARRRSRAGAAPSPPPARGGGAARPCLASQYTRSISASSNGSTSVRKSSGPRARRCWIRAMVRIRGR